MSANRILKIFDVEDRGNGIGVIGRCLGYKCINGQEMSNEAYDFIIGNECRLIIG